VGLVEHVGAHKEIVEVQLCRAFHVGADATHPGSEVDYEIWFGVSEELANGAAITQVVLGT
jgi:hypothetical protein